MVLHFITTVKTGEFSLTHGMIWNIECNQQYHLLLAELNSGHGFCVPLCSLTASLWFDGGGRDCSGIIWRWEWRRQHQSAQRRYVTSHSFQVSYSLLHSTNFLFSAVILMPHCTLSRQGHFSAVLLSALIITPTGIIPLCVVCFVLK